MTLFIQRSQPHPLSLKYSGNFPLETLPDVSTALLDIGCDCQWKEIHVQPSWGNLPKLLLRSWDTLESLVLTTFDNSRAHNLNVTPATRLVRLSIIRDIKSSILFYDFLKFHWHVLALHS